jgi:hypothetical protein
LPKFRSGTIKQGNSGHFLFYFYFKFHDAYETNKLRQLLETYARMFQKCFHQNPNHIIRISKTVPNYPNREIKALFKAQQNSTQDTKKPKKKTNVNTYVLNWP